jgi:hypothetical protein
LAQVPQALSSWVGFLLCARHFPPHCIPSCRERLRIRRHLVWYPLYQTL